MSHPTLLSVLKDPASFPVKVARDFSCPDWENNFHPYCLHGPCSQDTDNKLVGSPPKDGAKFQFTVRGPIDYQPRYGRVLFTALFTASHFMRCQAREDQVGRLIRIRNVPGSVRLPEGKPSGVADDIRHRLLDEKSKAVKRTLPILSPARAEGRCFGGPRGLVAGNGVIPHPGVLHSPNWDNAGRAATVQRGNPLSSESILFWNAHPPYPSRVRCGPLPTRNPFAEEAQQN